jgi:uncharacterized protein (TIGR03089 family)
VLPDPAVSGLLVDSERPLLTYYDDATGERTALSAAALGAWTARTATLLRSCGLRWGDRAAVLLPPHWQTAAILLGLWSSGIAVSFRGAATAGLPALGGGQHEPFDVTFVARHRIGDWLDNVPTGNFQFAVGTRAPLGDVPEGYQDYLAEAGGRPTDTPAYDRVRGSDPATVDGTSFGAWDALARGIAQSVGMRRGDRLLIDASASEEPVKWLLAPLAAGASIVLCANLDPSTVDAKVAAEGVTRVV